MNLPYRITLAAAGFALAGLASTACAVLPAHAPVHHVLLISVDGMHGGDLRRYVDTHPHGTLAALARSGVIYSHAHTVAPADSFPGLAALLTGGTPAVTGLYYDVSYDRTLEAPGSACTPGDARGTRVAYDESIDTQAAGGGDGSDHIDPQHLPRDPSNGCAPVFPHTYLRVNTVFNVVRAAGGYTAWIDKHPAYEFVDGPDGHGVDDLFLPEIGANHELQNDAPEAGITASLARTEAYDRLKADAIVDEIGGRSHDGRAAAPVPNVFGMNFQALNVAQKLYGYRDARGDLTPGVIQALDHVDRQLARFESELGTRGLTRDTLVVVTAKHGNGPIDPARLKHVDTAALEAVVETAAPGQLAQLTPDHGALIWLRDPGAAAGVAAALREKASTLGIAQVLTGAALDARLGLTHADSRRPDLVVITRDGVIFSKPGDGKLAEHGGFHRDDTDVALLLASPQLASAGARLGQPVSTTQVAPAILAALGLDPQRLRAVVEQKTATLPGMRWRNALAVPPSPPDPHS